MRVAINGFGRIGRCVVRNAFLHYPNVFEFVAINDLTDPKTLAHLFKYDSVHGTFPHEVSHDTESISINGKKIKIISQKDPALLPWKSMEAGLVLESTGLFTGREAAGKHLSAGAKKVLISAPAKDPDVTLVKGVNDKAYDPAKHHIISNASCTTNCLAPLVKVLHQNFKIKHGTMTTIHSYTNDQNILDLPHKDLRRARAAALSMIPTTTGAAKAVGIVLPEMQGKIDGLAIRVPTPNVSLVDFVAEVEKDITRESVNNAFLSASKEELKGILMYSNEPLVSCDFNGNTYSAIFDAEETYVIDKRLIKVLAWYDNEVGYSMRCLDIMNLMGKKL
jgi:glyceraldehyde 3-phosphate dehydrogenase